MTSNKTATVIIAFYKRLDFLEKLFEGLKNQSQQDFEVIVAEDDNSQQTNEFIAKQQTNLPFLIRLVSQEDKGFRKNKILNEALKIASSENILFLDGDSIPHRNFVEQYCKNLTKGTACFGRRVMLGKKFTTAFLQQKGIKLLRILSVLYSDSEKIEEGLYLPWYKKTKKEYRGIWGCNWGITRQDLIDVNGFDEDYIHAGVGEDNDIEWRLRLHGVIFKSLKHKAIVYHLHHNENYNFEAILINKELFEKKKMTNKTICLNGLIKISETN